MNLRMFCVAILTMLVVGCQSLPTMNADQIAAVPQGGAICSSADGIWGKVKFVVINSQPGVIPNGGIDANSDCTLSMRNVAVPSLPPLPPMPKVPPIVGAPPK